ncbi:BEL1-like homeodomain protein 5 [Arabidopsis thaliana]|uniref:BEL1-like homeodomain protein 5 n=4 Tax=Arabidopsis TaxID=3701 RepID=BLH5_ARATH|nr:BEL1-like homeodomain 5 [Arabidopsis thaliana]NP_180290.2 BEL1-like homeodomain 5 [Arabidopsis thaliana]Q8S897.2 RecName: Full=BEL1-like homeodomain protein 5; Short=BEL1-like protein 5 [Arabidopsis thaliana]pir/C84670/ probable homeodomain transcription factor [imported] - Arabidopsis thaliana [Arabidopsis thaliana]KAG7637624.1 POX domain [Arabidopsis thaliana x Arabidopsis arenosa]KAG7642243.1 POX domain [Arabidopsis suecica]AAY78695.1 homeodomain-containing protein [Arabidopsis thaliana|eukprot:NP_001318297.1 BEL1-like homeodomain 5 [Arabidopsis thaliana]
MAAFFLGESEMREHSSDLFMMTLNPFREQTTTTNAHDDHFYNLCFGSQQYRPRDEVGHIEQGNSSISTFSNGGVFRALAPIYLKAAQELLNEIVNVGNGSHGAKQERPVSKESTIYGVEDINGGYKPGVAALQMKKAKLISMGEMVEQRYKQYHDQMQTIISSFEQAAGLGSANSYTHMALQTISKQFRAVKDMISLQIKQINKLLGQKEFDEQLKKLGKMAHHHSNAWRPQRGLPEKAVSVLRSWLFEHFLHPYPRDLDKVMLAKQTGLTKSQVSNWFINARVRMWKPLVEELYSEEMDIEESRKGSDRYSTKGSSSKQPYNNTTSNESSNTILPAFRQGFTETETPRQNSSSSCSVVMRFTKQHMNQANFINFNGGFENYHTMDGNSVSLSLGLPHSCDQTFNNIHFESTSHGTENSAIYSSSTYQIMD